MRSFILHALKKKYEGQIASARANVEVYLQSPVGIGEHADIVGSIDSQVALIAEAQEKLLIISNIILELKE